ncbi:Hypothetical_protein [Hexamita inflata]|uniref:Hypothetical_protein n=1 Tax=Hexamita inflata TaxID=28002 RepID=A0AA86RL67_9EUKA|nr:Hypothetical protein HINF_LOCUS7090 [Hexamita inflata]CAI9925142.1 Hypothetical protein HINF_LOCUS12787 [Hexamita inflata]CAI9975663.1 Hypothetical protein HINF_LOCUS63308 [Hexamita inflata]
MTTRQLGWKINKDVMPESTDATKEYKWYESSGWKLVNIKTEDKVDEAGVPIKPVDKPGYVLKLNSKNKWCYHIDLTDRNNKPACNKKDKEYFWNQKANAWKLATVIYADKNDKYSFVAPTQEPPKQEPKQEQPKPQVDDSKKRQEMIEQEIDKYYQKKEQELQAKMAQQAQPVQQAPQVPQVQQPKIVFDNPLLNKYM